VDLVEARPVVLITGISASGKSTVAELLSRRFDRGVHVRGDTFRKMITRGRQDMTTAPTSDAVQQLRLRYALGASTADAYHSAGFGVVVQDVVLGAHLGEYVASMLSRPLVVVVLAPSPRAVAERERGRSKTAYRDGFSTIIELDRALRTETPRIGLWLDSSDQRPDETIDEIEARGLTEGLVA
jgi:cytidylate kinase